MGGGFGLFGRGRFDGFGGCGGGCGDGWWGGRGRGCDRPEASCVTAVRACRIGGGDDCDGGWWN